MLTMNWGPSQKEAIGPLSWCSCNHFIKKHLWMRIHCGPRGHSAMDREPDRGSSNLLLLYLFKGVKERWSQKYWIVLHEKWKNYHSKSITYYTRAIIEWVAWYVENIQSSTRFVQWSDARNLCEEFLETSGVADVTEVSESCVAGFGSRNRRNSFLALKFDNTAWQRVAFGWVVPKNQ